MPQKQSPASPASKSFTIVGMAEEMAKRLQARLGLLEATCVDVCTPLTFTAPETSTPQVTLMVYQDCLPYLYEQMAAGTVPRAALEDWITQAEAFLGSLRANRAAVFPVSLDLALGDPDTLRTALKDTYECVFRNDAPGSVGPVSEEDPACEFLAMDAFIRSVTARRLQAELDASGRGYAVRPVRKTPDIDAVFQNLMTTRAAHAGLVQDAHLTAELLALKERELTAAKAETANAVTEIDRLKADHHSAQKALETLLAAQRDDVDKLRNDVAQERANKNILEDQVKWAQSELRDALTRLDQSVTDRTRFEEEVASLHETVSARDAHIEAIRVSTSWRLTGPLRRLRRLFWKRNP